MAARTTSSLFSAFVYKAQKKLLPLGKHSPMNIWLFQMKNVPLYPGRLSPPGGHMMWGAEHEQDFLPYLFRLVVTFMQFTTCTTVHGNPDYNK